MKTNLEKVAKSFWNKFSREKIVELRKIPTGFKNKSYFIKSEDKREYVLKIYAQNFLTKNQIEERGKIVKKLESKNIPVLEMVKGLDNSFVQEIKSNNETHLATLSKYIEIPFSELQVNKDIINTVAHELKRLHKELATVTHSNDFKKLDIKTVINSLIEEPALEKIREHFKLKRQRSKRVHEFIEFYLKEGQKLLNYFIARKDLLDKTQLNHGDFNLGNFLVENGKIIKIFDFDEMIIAPKTYEIALSVYYLDYPEEFYSDELLQLFLESYFEKTEISREIIEDITAFMRYRAFYRLGRYFIYYQFTDNPGGHFTKFRRHLEKFTNIDSEEIYKIISKNS